MRSARESWLVWGTALAVVILTTIPYAYAHLAAGDEHRFGGFLLNPIDGNSYLAKMAQGRSGSWQFRLTYSAEPGDGAYLFLFYLSLGHLARLMGLSNLLLFHLARVVAGLALILTLHAFLKAALADDSASRWGLVLAAVGSGLGWLALPLGGFTSDFWVAEAYPFLAVYVNPHFPLGLALMLGLLVPVGSPPRREIMHFIGAAALAWTLPFGVVIALLILAGLSLWKGSQTIWALHRLGWVCLGGGSSLLLQYWQVQAHPALSGWNAQNLTPAPAIPDLIVSFSPALIIALASLRVLRRESRAGPALLGVWAVAALAIVYVPFNLQRRMLMGYYIPVAGLAIYALGRAFAQRRAWFRRLALGLLALSLPTNLVLLAAAWHGVQTRDPQLYLSRGEALALAWLSEHSDAEALVLASPDMGLFIPAHAGRRVIYGHPFETLNAQAERAALEALFQGIWEAEEVRDFVSRRGVDYLFWGPRERRSGASPDDWGMELVYQADGVEIYRPRPPEPGSLPPPSKETE